MTTTATASRTSDMRDPAVTSRIMAAVRGKDTQPELMLRRALHRRGLRYRLHDKRLPGRPDIVFPRARVALFVDGDFWHGQGWKERGFASFDEQFTNYREPEKWRGKIRRNIARDEEVNAGISALGWTVIRVWESDVRRDVNAVAERVQATLLTIDLT